MHRISAGAAIFCVALTFGCGLVLGLGDVRNCEGQECGDAAIDVSAGDAAVDQDASAPPPAWTPAAFGSDLALWLATDYGVTATNGSVAAWKDRAHDAVAIGSANQPHLDKTVAGNQDAIHFTLPDSVLQMPDSTFLQIAQTDAFLIEVVARVNALDDTPAHFWAKADTSGTSFGKGFRLFAGLTGAAGEYAAHFDDGVTGYDVPSNTTPFKDGAFHMVGLRRALTSAGSVTRFNLDGLEEMGGSDNADVDIAASGFGAFVGHVHPAGVDASACDYSIAEIIIVRRSTDITPLDLAHVFSYLKAKYGL